MLESVKRLLEFVGDMNATEINDHIKARPDGFAVSFRIDNEWLDGWNRAVLATIEKIEKEVAERYMELPLDAGGVPWHLGDVTENGNTVRGLRFDQHGWHFFGTVNDIDPSIHRHHHAPTVEDVLREFALAVCKDDALTIRKGVVDDYAAKLQLREDA